MRIADLGDSSPALPATSRCVRMNELRLSRSRPDQHNLHDDVVQPVRQRMQHARDLRTTLDLKRPDGFTTANQIVRLRVRYAQFVNDLTRELLLVAQVKSIRDWGTGSDFLRSLHSGRLAKRAPTDLEERRLFH